MADDSKEKKSSQGNQWWYVEDLIAGLAASPRVKYLLTLVHRHTHSRKGFAWASQKELAREMNVSLRTVERAWATATHLGVVKVRRVRTGKHPADQHNEYSLDIERLKELQRPREHPTRMAGDTPEHPTAMAVDSNPEHPSNSTPNTRQNGQEHPSKLVRTPVTGDGIGFEVSGSEYFRDRKAHYNAKPAAPYGADEREQPVIQHPVYVGTPKTAPASEKMVSLLTAAGPNGLSPNQLAEEIYNEPASGPAGCRIVEIVVRLRKKGYQIISTGNGAGAGVYILREN